MSEDNSKLLFWVMGALLAIVIAGLGWYSKSLDSQLKALETRLEAYSQREIARAETLTQTSGARWERLSVLEARVVSMEPRVGDAASKSAALEARLPLAESKITSADARLQRIEEKLDRILATRSGR
jgi:chromosome segregation ATPase